MTVVNSEYLKHLQAEIGIKLANACLDSELLYNSEIWTKIKSFAIKKLE